ncbi:tRNA uridine-5-carboxymethylaminomethyl(34) synthesis GTPase MnmE [Hoeflea sp.]|uniref:tRNA uridine-5-carboxymethylaminomethyl(34) synthesis GTPase MnmE n=1 Tax=Hoeflea sp. TaxID=1940281 RepID=UPI0019BA58CA|nr:tRNA uridine-5-carboxymethylaminomethyl(34) synthesis GTPase MnmE [Hoeflea sp.]MBC7280268.1 tRNA uridine-5-carboxymethylaminomethyl(34) synthesis GTPase MnmE [Hoeflea sp.]
MRDTIYALSSGHPPAGVAVIRISGPGVRFGLETVAGSVPAPRWAKLSDIRDGAGQLLDQGLVIFFPAPHSFTGEDVAELQIHGSRASISAVLAALSEISGFRPADAGEFTRRAFENGRMDLTAVEGLSDLIRAETESQRKQALSQAGGHLRLLYEGWARRLTHARAMIEAEIDFSDEEDIPGSVADRVWPDMQALAGEIQQHLKGARAGEIVRSGFQIALVGAPNVGKSSLLNALAQRDVAIVSDVPGTTRDVIQTRLDIGGYLVLLMDTAGIRASDNPVELEGMRRTLLTAESADLVLELRSLGDGVPEVANEALAPERLIVWTKSDLVDNEAFEHPDIGLLVSSKTGHGLDALLHAVADRLSRLDQSSDGSLPTRERHRILLKDCLKEVQAAVDGVDVPIEIRSELLRVASGTLGKITGSVDVEQLLGVIFSEFCVGK